MTPKIIKVRRIYFRRRRPDGSLAPMMLELDDRNVELSLVELPGEEGEAIPDKLPERMPPTRPPRPALSAEVRKFFDLDQPCFFDGCEELREQWRAFLEPHIPDGEDDCPGCAKTALMEQFRPRLDPVLRARLDG